VRDDPASCDSRVRDRDPFVGLEDTGIRKSALKGAVMSAHKNQLLAVDRGSKRRSPRAGLTPITRRIANTLRGTEDHDSPPWEQHLADWPEEQRGTVAEELLPRFPLTRHGYDYEAVDEQIAELERELAAVDQELAELRARRESRDEIAVELKRIGDQTSAVLIAANEQRDEMLREAQAEADRLVADATAKSRAVTAEGEARLRELDAQTQAVHRERDRLLEDARSVSAALAALADSAHEQIPPKQDATARPEDKGLPIDEA
jgi:DivIVA protein